MNLAFHGRLNQTRFTLFTVLCLCLTLARAGEADIVGATVTPMGENRYRIDATVLHADTGWDHYADRWEVLDTDGNIIDTRVLAHPHVNEQPFTRSLVVLLPEGLEKIILRANDSVHGLGGKTYEINLSAVKD